MAENKFKTGEKAPESGTYKVDSLVNGGSTSDSTTIEIQENEPFPPSPSENEAAYWVKAS